MLIADRLKQIRLRTEQQLDSLIPEADSIEPSLQQAMRYGLFNGGKRIRPALVYLACELSGGTPEQADKAAAAIECIHSYSLIHDDLPAMDNDDLRRGKPTCHIAFDEATAILAGDALLTFAFELLSQADPHIQPTQQLQMIRCLSKASGERGMVLGQAFDLAHVGQALTLEQLQAMHSHKTGALIVAALELGALAAGSTDPHKLEHLRQFGQKMGLAFQIKDDLLDIEGDTETLGKPQGSDQLQNKPTYPALLGLEGARERLKQLHHESIALLEPYGEPAQALIDLADYIVNRNH
ncbi:polyprenyl synthetase family protein [Nitrincola sp. MINF-07-Sa-05]|uniref:polyprenyl synthetase family protein n=1 Tax=Nitrincola salilacus TaxID=3400273 RepID=UPI003917F905